MSLEKINQYLKELEAVKFYDAVKKKMEASSSENQSLREVTVTVGEEKLTLPQLRAKVLQVKADEIKTAAEKLFETHKSNWEVNEKPKLIYQEAVKSLSLIIDNESQSQQLNPESEVDSNLPEKVRAILGKKVNEKMDYSFQIKVGTESDRKAAEKLKALVKEAWPRWFELNLQPKIDQLMGHINSNVLTALRGPWVIRCSKCNAVYNNEMLTPANVESLITTSCLSVDCGNQSGNLGAHEFTVSLSELLKNRLNQQSQLPIDIDNRNVF